MPFRETPFGARPCDSSVCRALFRAVICEYGVHSSRRPRASELTGPFSPNAWTDRYGSCTQMGDSVLLWYGARLSARNQVSSGHQTGQYSDHPRRNAQSHRFRYGRCSGRSLEGGKHLVGNRQGRRLVRVESSPAEGRRICGTPGYIAPELFLGKKADTRSDIYSFGLVLWQMAAGSSLPPFHMPHEENIEKYLRGVFEQQMKGRVPRVGEPLQSIVERCLTSEPSTRYGSFEKLRTELESILKRTGFVVRPPSIEHKTAASCSDKGYALHILGRHEEAIALCANALELDPLNATAWNTKGLALDALGQHTQAVACFAKFLEIAPRDPAAWNNMAMALSNLGRHDEAVASYRKALEIDPHRPRVWNNAGYTLYQLNRNEEAIACFAKALEIDPQNALFWNNKGHSLHALGRYEQAIASLTKAVESDPLNGSAWNKRGEALRALGREEEAIACFAKALESDTSNEITDADIPF